MIKTTCTIMVTMDMMVFDYVRLVHNVSHCYHSTVYGRSGFIQETVAHQNSDER